MDEKELVYHAIWFEAWHYLVALAAWKLTCFGHFEGVF